MIRTWAGGLAGQPLSSKPAAYTKVFGAAQASTPDEMDEPRDLDEPQSEPSPAAGRRANQAQAAAALAASAATADQQAPEQHRWVVCAQGDGALRESARLALGTAALKASPERRRLEQREPDPRLAAARARGVRCASHLCALEEQREELQGALRASEAHNAELLQLVQEMRMKQSWQAEESSQLREEMAVQRAELAEARLELQIYAQARERHMMQASSYTHAYY